MTTSFRRTAVEMTRPWPEALGGSQLPKRVALESLLPSMGLEAWLVTLGTPSKRLPTHNLVFTTRFERSLTCKSDTKAIYRRVVAASVMIESTDICAPERR